MLKFYKNYQLNDTKDEEEIVKEEEKQDDSLHSNSFLVNEKESEERWKESIRITNNPKN